LAHDSFVARGYYNHIGTMRAIIALVSIIVILEAVQGFGLNKEWECYKFRYSKTYINQDEHDDRKAIFEKNQRFIESHNAKAALGLQTYTVKLNHLADKTSEEIQSQYMGFQKPPIGISFTDLTEETTNNDVPNSMDWRAMGYVTPVKNQGECKSEWAFSAVGTIEGANFKATGHLESLSVQELIDCPSRASNGCNGGCPYLALEYVNKTGGIGSDHSYPYKGHGNNTCDNDNKIKFGRIRGVGIVSGGTEASLQKAVGTIGPISVGIDASRPGFHFYNTGIYTDDSCSSSKVNFAALAVGYGSSYGQDYWTVKNSWGSNWGEMGYIRMARNHGNMCGIASAACYAIA